MVDDQLVLDELKKVFKTKDITKVEDLYEQGYSEKEVTFVKSFIVNRLDPIGWIKNNIRIKHPAHGSVPFDLYDFQENIIRLFLKKHSIVTLKSRQIGMSTLVQAISIWCAMNYPNYNILILSAGMRQATSFLGKIRFMYDNMPPSDFKIKLEINNRQSMEFENGSKITAIPATRNAALGESINLLIIDEAAFISNIEAVYQGAQPTLSRAFKSAQGKPYGVIVVSTPNGIGGVGKFYYELYMKAVTGENRFTPIKIHWSMVPEYDQKWYLEQCRLSNWNYQIIAAELELSFVSSGMTYIPGQILDVIGTIDPIVRDLDNALWIWELPVKDVPYVAGVDVAYGDRKDSSVIQILRADTLEQVAEYESNSVKVDDFASIIIKLCRKYNNALVNIERNTIGKVLIDKIIDKCGTMSLKFYRDINPTDLNSNMIKDSWKTNIGTLVTGQSRDIILGNMYSIIIDNYTEGLNNIISEDADDASAQAKFEALMSHKTSMSPKKQGIIKSERMMLQMLAFVVDEHGRPDAPHDDLIFAWSHSLYAYTKSKNYLLKDAAKVLSAAVGVKDPHNSIETKVEFMKKMAIGGIWDKVSAKDIQNYLEEETNQNSNVSSEQGSLANLYKNFYN